MIWFNGQLTSRASTGAASAGALLGWGVFTTLAIRAGQPVFWARHCARLARDAAAARVQLPFNSTQLRAGLDELLAARPIAEGLARITGTARGDGRWNLESGADWSILIQSAPAPQSRPLRLQVAPFRVAAAAPLAGVKTTSYLPYLHAFEGARAAGFDEALLLTESGLVCEGARASIFWLAQEKWRTPALSCGGLRGVGREVVLEISGAQQGQWELESLLQADEAFAVSGAAGVRAIGTIWHQSTHRIWHAPGPQTQRIGAEFGVWAEEL